MLNQGGDIPPDEDGSPFTPDFNGLETNGHSPLAGNDMEEDSGSHHAPVILSLRNTHIQEPLDMSTGPVYNGHRIAVPRSRRQAYNGTDYYKSEANRLQTFNDWRYDHIVKKEDLARNGFIYTGTSDKVRCVFCSGVLRQWEIGDVVEVEHRRNFGDCSFVLGLDVGNVPYDPLTNGHHPLPASAPRIASTFSNNPEVRGHDIDPLEELFGATAGPVEPRANAEPMDESSSHSEYSACNSVNFRHGYAPNPKNRAMALEPNRLATFSSWPAQMNQKPEDLAHAGLYYTGDGDKVRCFHCNVQLYNWEPNDDPFVEHARWFPDCPYLHLVKGDNFVKKVQKGEPIKEDDDVMKTPAVLAVLFEGYSEDIVRKAMSVIKEKEGPSVVITGDKLLRTVMDLETDTTATSNGILENNLMSSGDVQRLQRENEDLRDKQLCKVCMERDVDVIFYPCKHFVCCASCGAGLSLCPICRQPIHSLDNVFMA